MRGSSQLSPLSIAQYRDRPCYHRSPKLLLQSTAQPASLPTNPHSTHVRRTPTYLGDYVYNHTHSKDPLSIAHQLQDKSLGTPYPIANYVTYANFSISHQNFLTTITKVTEPKYHHEAAKDPRWRAILEEEIQALENLHLGPTRLAPW